MGNLLTTVSIGDIGETITGKTPSSKFPKDFGNEYMFVTPSDSFDNKYISKTERYLSEDGLSKLSSKILPINSIMITCIGSAMGKVSINKSISITNQQINSIKVSEKYSADYIYYVLKNNYKLLRTAATGSTALPLLNKTDFDALKLKIFEDKLLQKKIANVLSSHDSKIELNNKINQELESMAKTLYDYWFVQFDFPDANGKPYRSSGGKMGYNEVLKREIPEGWEVFSLSSILKSNYSSINKNDAYEEIEYLDTSSLTKNKIDATECLNLKSDKIPSRAKRIVNTNDILYSTVRPNLCHYGIIKDPLKNMIASTGFVQLTSKISWVSNDLIFTYLTSTWISERLHQIASLSVSSYPSISPNDILELNIALPKNGKGLEFINTTLDSIYSKISLNQIENYKLTELRDWLLPMLMNGQVKVS